MLISREGDLVTLINVFETKPEQQQELIDQWLGFFEQIKEAPPGLIGAALHRSKDGMRVINYAQWGSEADFDHFTKNYLRPNEQRQVASRVDPHLYEVVYHYERAGD
jgi:heme-degrading monooxygenase HmoA